MMSFSLKATPDAAEFVSPQRRRAILVVVALSLMMVVSAVSGLNVALPDLARDTGATATQLQWIVDAYTLSFAGLLLPAGALGDRLGRKGVLLAGLLIFGLAAADALWSGDPNILIWLRAAMGVGAALVMPTTLSVITTSFPPRERGRAIGLWVGVAGGGAVLGLFASGVLLEFYSWHSFYALNVTLAVLSLLGAIAVIPRSRDAIPPRMDPLGGLLSLLTVTGIVFAIIEGPARGWGDLVVISSAIVGLGSVFSFVMWELRRESPMLDPRLFLKRGFGTGSLSVTVQFFAAFGFFFVIMQYLQFVAGRSPLGAAVSLLPLPFILIPLARVAPRIAERIGFRRIGSLGLLLIAAGLLVMTRLGTELNYPLMVVGLVLFASGMALAGTPATQAITASLPDTKQGVASAVNDTAREFGSALGIAILGSLLNSGYSDGVAAAAARLPVPAAAAATQSIAVAEAIAARLGPAGEALNQAAQQAFVDGAHQALVGAAIVLAVAAAVIAWLGLNAATDSDSVTDEVSR